MSLSSNNNDDVNDDDDGDDDNDEKDKEQEQQHEYGRILSIQSHVVYGYVGNRVAVFPLQLLGFDVDVINSVQYSNHTGYEHGTAGDVLDGRQLLRILDGLRTNNLLSDIRHIVTGYIGSESFLRAVIQVVKAIRNNSNNNTSSVVTVRYVCDPVLGDAGRFYVPEQLVDVYRTDVLPLADVVTPNQFEAEQLTGVTSITTIDDAIRSCQILHAMGPNLVFITSIVLKDDDDEEESDDEYNSNATTNKQQQQSKIAILASQQLQDGTTEAWRVDTPLLPGQYTGTGDLCAALLLGHTALATAATADDDEDGNNHGNSRGKDLKFCIEQVANTMFAVIQRTHHASIKAGGNNSNSVAARELKLIQSKQDIENPPMVFRARRIR